MNRQLKTFLVVLILMLLCIPIALKVFPSLEKTMPDLNKPAPEWFKTVTLAFVGIMALVTGLWETNRLRQGKGAYIASRFTPTLTEDRGFLGVLFSLIWLVAGVVFTTKVFFRIFGVGQH